jgi:hypothetical protein
MIKGDLCHIPQGTILINEDTTNFLKPEKPTTGVFIEDVMDNRSCCIHVAGQRWLASKKDVYPIKENQNGETNKDSKPSRH